MDWAGITNLLLKFFEAIVNRLWNVKTYFGVIFGHEFPPGENEAILLFWSESKNEFLAVLHELFESIGNERKADLLAHLEQQEFVRKIHFEYRI